MSPIHYADDAEVQEFNEVDPLRHLISSEDSDACLLPPQKPSTQETIKLSYGDPSGSNSVVLTLTTDAFPGCGGVTWPAGEVLASYLVNRGSGFLKNKTIVELGSGTGLVGLVAGALGGRVWITDQEPLLDIMKQNVSLNALDANVSVEKLDWGQSVPDSIPIPDLVLAADCVYFEPSFEPLVKTLRDLVHGGRTHVLFCYKKRRKADRRFFIVLKKYFTWANVTDHPDHESYSREGISLFTLSLRATQAGS